MKLAVTGKGGAGKTTLSVFLARYLADQGRDVILIDADPDANAAMALGLDESSQPEPIADLKDLINERTGASGASGQLFCLNPKVDDIPERCAVEADGVKVLRMGGFKKGGTGCFCPENAFLRSLLSHLVLRAGQVVILDMEAGIEHLGRGTARGMDMMLVVVEPGRRSVQTAFFVKRAAADIGITSLGVVVNKYKTDQELAEIQQHVSPLPVVGTIPYDEAIAASDLKGVCPYTGSEAQRRWMDDMLSRIPVRATDSIASGHN